MNESIPSYLGDELFTSRMKRLFQMAKQKADVLGHRYIGTEHFLLALLDDADSIAFHILNNNVNIENMRDDITTFMGSSQYKDGSNRYLRE